jgi:hypothetical protein
VGEDFVMIALGLNHIGHAASAVSTVLHLPERSRTVAPTLLVTVQAANIALHRLKSHLPTHGSSGQSASPIAH